MTEKRFVKGYHTIRDIKENNVYDFQVNIMCDLLNEQEERIIDLKNTIIKITKAYQRKHDNTIVNLVDEIWEEDIEDLIIELNQDGGIRND